MSQKYNSLHISLQIILYFLSFKHIHVHTHRHSRNYLWCISACLGAGRGVYLDQLGKHSMRYLGTGSHFCAKGTQKTKKVVQVQWGPNQQSGIWARAPVPHWETGNKTEARIKAACSPLECGTLRWNSAMQEHIAQRSSLEHWYLGPAGCHQGSGLNAGAHLEFYESIYQRGLPWIEVMCIPRALSLLFFIPENGIHHVLLQLHKTWWNYNFIKIDVSLLSLQLIAQCLKHAKPTKCGLLSGCNLSSKFTIK